MSQEVFSPYEDRTVTVVGGRGRLGSKVVTSLGSLGFGSVKICEIGDPFPKAVDQSTDLFFAVDDTTILGMLRSARNHLRPDHTILDGSSVKGTLIPTYRELDKLGISVCSTHLGAVPTHPWRGVKVWLCEVGPNSDRAKRLASDLFLSTNSSIETVDIVEHGNVEWVQFFTMVTEHGVANTLRRSDFTLERFDFFSTLSAELQAQLIGRILGQGPGIPAEVIFNQSKKHELLKSLIKGLVAIEQVLDDREALEQLMQKNIDFHNQHGFVRTMFDKAGVSGARNANLRMFDLRFRITGDEPGKLIRVLQPFYAVGANITAIDSMPGKITDEEVARGVNPDTIIDFDIGIDPRTIDPEKEKRIKERLVELGCTV